MATQAEIRDFYATNPSAEEIAAARAAHPDVTDEQIAAAVPVVPPWVRESQEFLASRELTPNGEGDYTDANGSTRSAAYVNELMSDAGVQSTPSTVLGANGEGYYGTTINGKPYAFLSQFANNDPDPQKAMQIEIDYLRGRGINVINDPTYGPVALANQAYAEAHPIQKEDGFSAFLGWAIKTATISGMTAGFGAGLIGATGATSALSQGAIKAATNVGVSALTGGNPIGAAVSSGVNLGVNGLLNGTPSIGDADLGGINIDGTDANDVSILSRVGDAVSGLPLTVGKNLLATAVTGSITGGGSASTVTGSTTSTSGTVPPVVNTAGFSFGDNLNRTYNPAARTSTNWSTPRLLGA